MFSCRSIRAFRFRSPIRGSSLCSWQHRRFTRLQQHHGLFLRRFEVIIPHMQVTSSPVSFLGEGKYVLVLTALLMVSQIVREVQSTEKTMIVPLCS